MLPNTRKYQEKLGSKYAEYHANWRLANIDIVIKAQKKYRDNHPDKPRDDTRKRKARLLNVVSEKYTEKDVIEKWGTDCHICNLPIDLSYPRSVGSPGWQNKLHLDHVIKLAEGGPDVLENVKPSHGLCNLRKN